MRCDSKVVGVFFPPKKKSGRKLHSWERGEGRGGTLVVAGNDSECAKGSRR